MEPEFLKEHVNLSTHFAANGYKTLSSGKIFHTGGYFQIQGPRAGQWRQAFDQKVHHKPKRLHSIWDFGPQDYHESKFTHHITTTWVADQLGKDFDKPFFMAYGFYRPHIPFFPPRRIYKNFMTRKRIA